MCRLFGFRSNVPAQVHASLVREVNSLQVQSVEHKDGWGVASYGSGLLPEVARGTGAAWEDPRFADVSSCVSSHAVIAHVRLASVGPVRPENSHPFIYKKWTFAHNGTLQRFDVHRASVETLIDPDFRKLIQGDTDSERCFYVFLSRLREASRLDTPPLVAVARALTETARTVIRITEVGAVKPSSTNFLVTDGRLMVGTRRHRTLYFSEHRRHGEAPDLPPRDGEQLKQFVIASEKLNTESHWYEIPEESVIGVDADMTLRTWTFDQLAPGA